MSRLTRDEAARLSPISPLKNECHGSVSRESMRMFREIRTADTAVALDPLFFNRLLSPEK